MKKYLFVLVITFFLNIFIVSGHTNDFEVDKNTYNDFILHMLYPHVHKDICDYYDGTINTCPNVPPYVMKINNIEKKKIGYGFDYDYRITITVNPYLGAHNSVGIDKLIYSIDFDGIKLHSYQHLKDYRLPPHEEHYYR